MLFVTVWYVFVFMLRVVYTAYSPV